MKAVEAAPRVLIADDQADVLEALRLLLKGEGYRTEKANSPAKALAALEEGEFDVVLMDLNYARDTTSGQEGLDLLARILALDSALPVGLHPETVGQRPPRRDHPQSGRTRKSTAPGTAVGGRK